MPAYDLVLHENDFRRIQEQAGQLLRDTSAKAVYLVDRNGQTIATSGDLAGVDQTSLASLTAGNVAATEGLAQIIGEQEFSSLYHEGRRDHIYLATIGKAAILVVVFDERTTLGLVRLRVRRASGELDSILEEVLERTRTGAGVADAFGSPFAEITDDDIENLFSD